jgi:excisionase family DNA binding protein
MDQIALKIEEVAKMLGLGRSKTAALIAAGEIPSFLVGRSRRVHVDLLRAWIADRAGVPNERRP